MAVSCESSPYLLVQWLRTTNQEWSWMDSYCLDPQGNWIQARLPFEEPGRISSLPRVAVDVLGRPHLCYGRRIHIDSREYEVTYRYLSDGEWCEASFTPPCEGGQCESISVEFFAVASDMVPRAVYEARCYHDDGFDGELRHLSQQVYRDYAGWHSLPIPHWGQAYALSSDGHASVCWYDGDAGCLKYGYEDATGWHTDTIDETRASVIDISLALDSEKRPHVAYQDTTHLRLKYAYRQGEAWQIEVVDEAGNVGASCSLALDSHDNPHIAYQDTGLGDLKYAHWESAPIVAWFPTVRR